MIGKEVVDRIKHSDMTAFDEVYRLYCHKLYGFVHHIIKSESDAEEIVQEVFVKLWESRHKLETFRSFDGYIFTIAYNTSISLLRRRVSEKKYLEQFLFTENEEYASETADEIQFIQLKDKLNVILEQLPPRQKEVFYLNREKGLTYREIAEKLGISENTVEIHMGRALKQLKEKMNRESFFTLLFIFLFI